MLSVTCAVSQKKKLPARAGTGIVTLKFENVINHQPVVLTDSTYLNPFGEPYNVTKFRYYITNVVLHSKTGDAKELNSYHLVDEAKPASKSFRFPVKYGEYTSLTFLLGVDSLHNVSGAQTGALDPLNDMFWTWNTGYVMLKLEGHSAVSSLQNNIFEYHIGGFKGINNTLKTITLNMPGNENLVVTSEATTEIVVNADISEFWKGEMDVQITKNGSINSPGTQAKRISGNYKKMFSIHKVTKRKII